MKLNINQLETYENHPFKESSYRKGWYDDDSRYTLGFPYRPALKILYSQIGQNKKDLDRKITRFLKRNNSSKDLITFYEDMRVLPANHCDIYECWRRQLYFNEKHILSISFLKRKRYTSPRKKALKKLTRREQKKYHTIARKTHRKEKKEYRAQKKNYWPPHVPKVYDRVVTKTWVSSPGAYLLGLDFSTLCNNHRTKEKGGGFHSFKKSKEWIGGTTILKTEYEQIATGKDYFDLYPSLYGIRIN